MHILFCGNCTKTSELIRQRLREKENSLRSNVFVCSVLGVLSASVAVSFNHVCFCQRAAWNSNWELLLDGASYSVRTCPNDLMRLESLLVTPFNSFRYHKLRAEGTHGSANIRAIRSPRCLL
nr:PREDICTED: uncharacterized protein LOC108952924 [Musa acuminata subsp. malaccensis]